MRSWKKFSNIRAECESVEEIFIILPQNLIYHYICSISIHVPNIDENNTENCSRKILLVTENGNKSYSPNFKYS